MYYGTFIFYHLYTHIYEIFCFSAIIYFLLKNEKQSKNKYLIFIGIFSSLLFLIRPIFIPIILFSIIYIIYKSGWRDSLIKLLLICISASPFILIFFLYNYISYGDILSSGYSITRGETFNLSEFNGLKILFSQYRGWIIYSPIILISFTGLILLFKRNKS